MSYSLNFEYPPFISIILLPYGIPYTSLFKETSVYLTGFRARGLHYLILYTILYTLLYTLLQLMIPGEVKFMKPDTPVAT